MRIDNFIDGAFRAPSAGRYVTDLEPATGQPLAEVARSDAPDVEAAFEAARRAQPAWAALPLGERIGKLRKWVEAVKKDAASIGLVEARDTGSPVRSMRADVNRGVNKVGYFCDTAYELGGETIPASAPDNLHYTRREPFGVVGIIIPYNHPAMFSMSKTASALVAGNAVVLKPSELTPMSVARIAELTAGHLPPGVFNVVHGGPEVGQALIRHPEIWRIGFTGGVKTGLAVLRGSTETGRVKRVSLELGGKNPIIVYPDARLEAAAEAAFHGMNFTRCQGQSCGSTSRLFVHRSVHRRLTEAVVAMAKAVKLGLPQEEDTEMGCLVSRGHQERVLGCIERGRAEGARLLTGGGVPEGPLAGGAYVEPTVFDGVDPGMELAREEVFGPVLAVIPWDDEEEMIRAVNRVDYGLTAAVWTESLTTALRAVNRIEAGYIWVNGIERRYIGMPFGGYKNSGLGMENNYEELVSFTREKAVNIILP